MSASWSTGPQFILVFKTNDMVHHDGHANYGGGLFIGDQSDDIRWASDIGGAGASSAFSIGACHAAGYFADHLYNELRSRTSLRIDIVAAVNATAFDDPAHQSVDFVRAMLQDLPPYGGEPPGQSANVAELEQVPRTALASQNTHDPARALGNRLAAAGYTGLLKLLSH